MHAPVWLFADKVCFIARYGMLYKVSRRMIIKKEVHWKLLAKNAHKFHLIKSYSYERIIEQWNGAKSKHLMEWKCENQFAWHSLGKMSMPSPHQATRFDCIFLLWFYGILVILSQWHIRQEKMECRPEMKRKIFPFAKVICFLKEKIESKSTCSHRQKASESQWYDKKAKIKSEKWMKRWKEKSF